MNERIKTLRKELGKKQGDFANDLSISQGHLSDIENGRREVSERIISICTLKFNVREQWLRTGEGEMFRTLTRSQTITDFMGDLVVDDNSFKARLIEALAKLDESEWETLEKIAKDIVQNGGS